MNIESIATYAAAREETKPFATIIRAAKGAKGVEFAAQMAATQGRIAKAADVAARFNVIAKRLRRSITA